MEVYRSSMHSLGICSALSRWIACILRVTGCRRSVMADMAGAEGVEEGSERFKRAGLLKDLAQVGDLLVDPHPPLHAAAPPVPPCMHRHFVRAPHG